MSYEFKSDVKVDGDITSTGTISGAFYGDGSGLTNIVPTDPDAIPTTDTSTSGYTWVINEYDFSSESQTKVPTQKSIKEYITYETLSPSRAFNSGGNLRLATIDKCDFASNVTAVDHGDLTVPRFYSSGNGCSSSTQGYQVGGITTGGVNVSDIDKFKFSSNTTSSSHGDLVGTMIFQACASSRTHGFSIGGKRPDTVKTDIIEKFDFSSNTTASDHGDLTEKHLYQNGHESDTQGFFSGGVRVSTITNTIEKFDFSSNTTATDHGDIVNARYIGSGCSSETQGFNIAGYRAGADTKDIHVFDFASNTTASNHGDLVTAVRYNSTSSSFEEGISFGGINTVGITDIEKFDFASNTTASDHGDLTVAGYGSSGMAG